MLFEAISGSRSLLREEQGHGDLKADTDPLDRIYGQLTATLLRVFESGIRNIADLSKLVEGKIPLSSELFYTGNRIHKATSSTLNEKEKVI